MSSKHHVVCFMPYERTRSSFGEMLVVWCGLYTPCEPWMRAPDLVPSSDAGKPSNLSTLHFSQLGGGFGNAGFYTGSFETPGLQPGKR